MFKRCAKGKEMDLSERIAKLVAGVSYEDLPEETVLSSKMAILDTLGARALKRSSLCFPALAGKQSVQLSASTKRTIPF